MYNFILQIAIMLSLGTIIYLMARTVPRIGDEIDEEIIRPKTRFDRLFTSSQFEKLDAMFNNFVEKLLRKIKLMLLKLDNITSNYLDKVKKYKLNDNGPKNEEGKPNLFNNNSKE